MSEKEILITEYLKEGFVEVDVTKTDGVCNAFSGYIEGGIKTDTDDSKYVTVIDLDGNAFDVPLTKIDLP